MASENKKAKTDKRKQERLHSEDVPSENSILD